MEDPLLHIGDMLKKPGRPVWRLFEESVSRAIQESAAPGSTVITSPLPHLGDLVIRHVQDSRPTVIELKVWTAHSKYLRNRVNEYLSMSGRIRRSFPKDIELCLFVALRPSSVYTAPAFDKLITRLTDLLPALIRENSEVPGFDKVVIGIRNPASEDSVWLEVIPDGLTPLDSFTSAIKAVSKGREPVFVNAISQGPQLNKFLLVADEWTSRTGGISTFNRSLAIALADSGREVYVVVPEASLAERDSATDDGVTLIVPDSIPGVSGKELLLTKPRFAEDDFAPDVIVGHGRILGPYAYALKSQFYPDAKRLHIVHTDAESLELAKEADDGPSRMTIADERRQLEVELALSSDLVAGVGPLLAESIAENMRGARTAVPPVMDLRPGLRDWDKHVDPNDPPTSMKVLFLGRAEDVKSKGVDIGVKAVSYAHAKWNNMPHRTALPELIVRGVPDKEADSVKDRVRMVDPNLKVTLRPYVTDEQSLLMDLHQCRVLIMPSRHEGFGLAAYEGIAAGIPVLITRSSGLARMLIEVLGDYTPPEVLATEGIDESSIIALWGEALYANFTNPAAAFARAKRVREHIASATSWSHSVQQLVDMLS